MSKCVPGFQVQGYVENWASGFVKWYSGDYKLAQIFGKDPCTIGCIIKDQLTKYSPYYNTLIYSFVLMNPHPDPNKLPHPTDPSWDGQALHTPGTSYSASNVAEAINVEPQIFSYVLRDISIMAYQQNQRFLLGFGGWSDQVKIGNNAKKAADILTMLMFTSLADGVALDFEAISVYNEFDEFASLVHHLRENFNTLRSNWISNLKKLYIKLKSISNYPQDHLAYIEKRIETAKIPYFSIDYVTRFNGFLGLPWWSHRESGSKFVSDNEAKKLWPHIGSYIDSIQIMAYDDPHTMNHENILKNFVNGGVPKNKIVMGFEPGTQAAGGKDFDTKGDIGVAKYIKDNDFGGIMVWAIPGQPQNQKYIQDFISEAWKQIGKPGNPYAHCSTEIDTSLTQYMTNNEKFGYGFLFSIFFFVILLIILLLMKK